MLVYLGDRIRFVNEKHNFSNMEEREVIMTRERDRMRAIIIKKYMAEVISDLAEDLQSKAESVWYDYRRVEKEVVDEETGEVTKKYDYDRVKLDELSEDQQLRLDAIDKVLAKLSEMI